MPTLSVHRDALFSRLGRVYTEVEFDALCFDFGVELDEVLTEREAAAARQLRGDDGGAAGGDAGGGGGGGGAEEVLYYIAIPANRTDLLCLEGFALALNVFLGNKPLPVRERAAAGGSRTRGRRPAPGPPETRRTGRVVRRVGVLHG